ncbi:hypothetical protein BC826DRAFT_1012569 [Russula brevipes]|nr:hypothetical protein BC826DRAFT_1012569 [Russula brevipes]
MHGRIVVESMGVFFLILYCRGDVRVHTRCPYIFLGCLTVSVKLPANRVVLMQSTSARPPQCLRRLGELELGFFSTLSVWKGTSLRLKCKQTKNDCIP